MRVREFFYRGAALAPSQPVFDGPDRSFSYAEAASLSARIANAIAARGGGEETGIAILTPNDVRGLVCLLAIHQLGGTYVRLNFRSTAAETVHILRQSKAPWLFFHSDGLGLVETIRQEARDVAHFICLDRELDGFEGLATLTAGQSDAPPPLANDRAHVAMLASTGGTTGLPKLVMLSDGNIETLVAAQLASLPYHAPPVLLIASAMTHAASSLMHAVLAQGGTINVRSTFDPVDVLETIARERVTHIYLPPTAIYMLLDEPRVRTTDFASLAYVIYGSAPMATERLKESLAVFGPVMTQFYGQAECPMFISAMSPADHLTRTGIADDKRLTSCGRPTPFCTVAILDDDGNELPPGQPGEISVAGNLVMQGYLSEGRSAALAAGGWHRTGDVGYFDDEHFLYIVDRKKDLIISGGFNVYPGEIEQFLYTHPAVRECAVIGTPHEKWGEEVRAIVCLREGLSVTSDELIAFAKAGLGSIKAPKAVDFRPDLPKSAAGKILKKDLREPFWAGISRRV